jgi:osmoprotectant transport system permease protein
VSGVAAFWAAHGAELLALTAEHLALVGAAIAIAAGIGVPVGVFLTRRPAFSKPILALANVAQTVPSLALFGILIPLNVAFFGVKIVGGIGAHTAVAALVLYALLPIIRNTYTGISQVDPTVREAGRAMGLTDWQLLWKVELPLALEVILAGLRVATVITVGTATVAAAIDAGGLGKYIFRGLRMNDHGLILAGAMAAAAIAMAADALLGWVERSFAPGKLGGKGMPWPGVAAAAAAVVLVVWSVAPKGAGPHAIVVGSKDFTEQLILGELVAQTIERQAQLPVTRRFDLGGNLAHDALVAGEIDAYVEYTGTALMAVLKQPPQTDPASVLERVKTDYATRFGLTWTEPLGFGNTFAILVRAEEAERHHLKTISQAAAIAPRWRAGFGQDFMSRPDGYAGFARAYGLRFSGQPREMDLSLTYRALKDGQVDLIAGNATDGLIARYGLVQLEDDRHYFPPYDAVPVVRQAVLDAHPSLRDAFKRLGGVLTVDAMRELNFQVDGERREPKAVVEAFLTKRGL